MASNHQPSYGWFASATVAQMSLWLCTLDLLVGTAIRLESSSQVIVPLARWDVHVVIPIQPFFNEAKER